MQSSVPKSRAAKEVAGAGVKNLPLLELGPPRLEWYLGRRPNEKVTLLSSLRETLCSKYYSRFPLFQRQKLLLVSKLSLAIALGSTMA
jgi:hypothetical protein